MGFKKAEGEETAKIAKTSNLQYFPQKTHIFQGLKTYKTDKDLKKKCKERSSHTGDPPGAIFHDFASILELPGEPEMTLKHPKEESEKTTQKTPYSLTGPKRGPGGS